MNTIEALHITIGEPALDLGVLLRYKEQGATRSIRFVSASSWTQQQNPPVVSAAYLVDPSEYVRFWSDPGQPAFHGYLDHKQQWMLPAFFQNLLPEGVYRTHLAQLRGCAPDDHFELLAACGKDLPGAVRAAPVELSAAQWAQMVGPHIQAHMDVQEQPLEEGISLSGVQPKYGVTEHHGRYVARVRNEDSHIIAKLPVADKAYLPEVEHLGLSLAQQAGVYTCRASVEPLSALDIPEQVLDTTSHFLAVERFDRSVFGRVHCEDFCQVFGKMPTEKYSKAITYSHVGRLLWKLTNDESQVHELLRRLLVNELLGNPDMHLKNMGLWYEHPSTPRLSPAYDVVPYAVYHPVRGHALRIVPSQEKHQTLGPSIVRAFCNYVGIAEKPAQRALKDTTARVHELWPDMLASTELHESLKAKLVAHIESHPFMHSYRRRHASGMSSACLVSDTLPGYTKD